MAIYLAVTEPLRCASAVSSKITAKICASARESQLWGLGARLPLISGQGWLELTQRAKWLSRTNRYQRLRTPHFRLIVCRYVN